MERKLKSGRISCNYSVMKVSLASWTPHEKVSVLSRFRSSFGRFIVLAVFWGLGRDTFRGPQADHTVFVVDDC